MDFHTADAAPATSASCLWQMALVEANTCCRCSGVSNLNASRAIASQAISLPFVSASIAALRGDCQAVYRGEEGQRTPLIQPATPDTHDARRLATHYADGMACDEQQHNDIS